MKKLLPITGILILLLAVSISCKKKHVQPEAPVQEVSKYELIPGNYKMYDTLGNYLYAMEIIHTQEVTTNINPRDSLTFINFDGKYKFTYRQSTGNASNLPKYSFSLGVHDSLPDYDGHQIFLFGMDCHYSNDSLYLCFEKNNIKFYINEMIPYSRAIYKQVGIKQH